LLTFPLPVYCNLHAAKDGRNLSWCSSLSIFRCFAYSAIFYLTGRNWSVGGNFILIKLLFSLSTPFPHIVRFTVGWQRNGECLETPHPHKTHDRVWSWRHVFVFKPAPV
jgi:hypothetical protein